ATAVIAKSGAEYLRRKAAIRAERAKGSALDPQLKKFADSLRKLSVTWTDGTGRISGGRADLEWQAAYLVRRIRQRQFKEVLRRAMKGWEGKRRIEASGPWPPYSFVGKV